MWAVDPVARHAGLHRGQSHADARAALPALVTAPAGPEAELAALHALALWAERLSPLVALDGRDGLMLDLSGVTHLFGGEAGFLAEAGRLLDKAGIPARIAIADTIGAAWALARFAPDGALIAASGATRAALAGLPVAALRLSPVNALLLRRLRLRRIGDLHALPRAGLARRLRDADGLGVVQRLDQALGLAPEPLVPLRPPLPYQARVNLAEPVTELDGVVWQLGELAQALVRQLDHGELGARQLELAAFRSDGTVGHVAVRTSAPTRDVGHMLRLFSEAGLERLELRFGADALMLTAVATERLLLRQRELAAERGNHAADPAALAVLIDRLQARLGERAVRRPMAKESWLPERSELWEPAGPEATPPGHPPLLGPRPILLLHPPEPITALAELPDGAPARFTWRRVPHRVMRAAGPERIAREWWRGGAKPSGTRDYYRVEDEQGRRYWLFRQGLFERQEGEHLPTWFMHGIFP